MRSCPSRRCYCYCSLPTSGADAPQYSFRIQYFEVPACGSLRGSADSMPTMIEPTQPLRVLCADDNVLVLDMLSKTLQSAGHHVEVATDGRAAVSRVEEDPDYFQLIVTDTRMPRLDGFGVVQEARSAGFAGQIIVFANALSAEDRRRYADLHVDRVIDKPGKAGELVGAISELRASLI